MVRKSIQIILLITLVFLCRDTVYSKDKMVTVILASNLGKFKIAYESLQKTLRDMKKDGGMQLVLSTPNPDPSSWTNALKRAEGHDVDLIIAFGSPLVHSAIKEKVNVPIIFADVFEKQFIEGAKGQQQLGGVYNNIPLSTLLKSLAAVKSLKTVHVLYCPFEKESEIQAARLKELAAADRIGCELHALKTLSKISDFTVGPGDAIFVTSSIVLESGLARVVAFADNHSIPVVGLSESVVNEGGLMCLAPDPREQGAALGRYVSDYVTTGKLGQNTQVTKVNFVINLNSAKKINVVVPFAVLNNATRVMK